MLLFLIYAFINNNIIRLVIDARYVFAKYVSIRQIGVVLIVLNRGLIIYVGMRKYFSRDFSLGELLCSIKGVIYF